MHRVRDSLREVRIRGFGVGLLALATVAAASLLFRRRLAFVLPRGRSTGVVDNLYEAGL